MEREFEKEIKFGTERGRSPNGVPNLTPDEVTRNPTPGIDEGAGPETRNPSPGDMMLDGEGQALEPSDPTPQPSRIESPDSPPPRLTSPRRGRKLIKPEDQKRKSLLPEERLMILDVWRRSGLPAGDFAPLVGLSCHTLYTWKRRFEAEGPAGLMDHSRGSPRGSRLPELTKRTILMLKESNPDWGCQRISDMLARGPALPASPSAVAKVLHEAGYVMEEVTTRPHPDRIRNFERARPNQLWQSDLFTFILKRQNRRVYLVSFLDDHSRFIVGYGLHASSSTALVLEVLRSAIASYQAPEEILTDNGPQYMTWRGKSAFRRELEKQGIKHLVSKPRHPKTLGKVERFWGSLWRECVETAIFRDLDDARRRIGFYIDHYNFQRPHQGIGGLFPADRFFGAAPEVLRTLKERVAANSLDIARQGEPRAPFYLTGNVGGKNFSVHAEGERVFLKHGEGAKKEIDLVPQDQREEKEEEPVEEADAGGLQPLSPDGSPGDVAGDENQEEAPASPGTSPLDEGLGRIQESLGGCEKGEVE